jgi:antitoxin ParD1/3/4
MQAQKISISITKQQYEFIGDYQAEHHCKTRSEVIQEALYLLQQKQLESYYRQANNEIDPAFEITDADGLDDEAW